MSSTPATFTKRSFVSTTIHKLVIQVCGPKVRLKRKNPRKRLKFRVAAAAVRVVINMRN